MASHTTVLLSLAALVCLAALTLAAPQRYNDNDDSVSVFRERRTSQGRMRGYAALTMRRGSSVVFAGASSRHAPKYVVPAESVEDEEEAPEVQPVEASEEEDELQDEVEDEEEPTPAPVKPVRPSRARPSAAKPSRRPQKPQVEEEDDAPAPPKRGNKQRGGATAIATSHSVGDGASAKSHAIAYDGHFSGGQFRHRF